jgi:HicA-like toxin of HicAB toxin-antitoxin system
LAAFATAKSPPGSAASASLSSARVLESHEVWFNPATERRAIIPKHRRAIAEGTLRSILRQAGIDVDDFLA